MLHRMSTFRYICVPIPGYPAIRQSNSQALSPAHFDVVKCTLEFIQQFGSLLIILSLFITFAYYLLFIHRHIFTKVLLRLTPSALLRKNTHTYTKWWQIFFHGLPFWGCLYFEGQYNWHCSAYFISNSFEYKSEIHNIFFKAYKKKKNIMK